MRNRLLCLLVVLAMLISSLGMTVLSAQTESHPFTDVPGWADEYVSSMHRDGIMKGTGGTLFSPDGVFTREQLVVTLFRLASVDFDDADTLNSMFADGDKISPWAREAVVWAAKMGITSGIAEAGKLYFKPKVAVTRQEVAVFLMRYILHAELDADTTVKADIKDLDKVGAWALASVRACIRAGIINGNGKGYFDPTGVTTRAAAAKMLASLPEEKKCYDSVDPLLYVDDLAESFNFNGRDFVWIGRGGEAPTVEDEIGDIKNDALYFRQRDIEDRFGVEWLNYTPEEAPDGKYNSMVHAVRIDVLAGSGAFDAGYGSANTTSPLYLYGSLDDVSYYEHIDLDREWWSEDLMESLAIDDGLYALDGSIVTSNYSDSYALFFNKFLMAQYGTEKLYALAREERLTYDSLFEAASIIPENGGNGDVFRYGDPNGVAILTSYGETITKHKVSGEPYVDDPPSDVFLDIARRLSTVFGDERQSAVCLDGSVSDKYGYDSFDDMFADDVIAFYFAPLETAEALYDKDALFGVLPMPKGSVDQAGYVSYVDPWSARYAFVPRSVKSDVVTGVILEASAALGLKYLREAYCDEMLKNRYLGGNKDDGDMIDLILSERKHDAIDYFTGGFTGNDSSFIRAVNAYVISGDESETARYNLQAKVVNNNIRSILAGRR